MAWTEVQNVSYSPTPTVDFDNISKIYLLVTISSVHQVHSYDVGTDTLTQLSNFGSSVLAGPIFFENNLYCATTDGIYKYSGTGTTWNSVYSAPGGTYEIGTLARSPNQLVAGYYDPNTWDLLIRYSLDGTSWNNGTVDSTPALPVSLVQAGFFRFLNYANGVIPELYGLSFDGSTLSTNTYRFRAMRWDEASSTLVTEYSYRRATIGGTPIGDAWVRNYYVVDQLHWHNQSSSNVYASTLGTFITPANDGLLTARSLGFETLSFGWDTVSTNTLLYQMPPGGTPRVWDAGEIVDTTANVGSIEAVIRFPDDSVYLIAEDGAIVRIYSSDTPIADGPDITDNGKRLWIFKGNGIEWASRGLMVP